MERAIGSAHQARTKDDVGLVAQERIDPMRMTQQHRINGIKGPKRTKEIDAPPFLPLPLMITPHGYTVRLGSVLGESMNHKRALSGTASPAAFARCTIRSRATACTLTAVLAASCLADAKAELAIVDLGQLPDTPAGQWPESMGISADGHIAVGSRGNRAFRWDGTLHALQGGRLATAASADGSVVVGTLTSPNHAFRWTAAGGLQDLGTLPGSTGSDALGVSGDGAVVVGSAATAQGSLAWIWDATAGLRSLGTLGAGTSNAATAVSRDGLVVVGYSGHHAFRWTTGTGMVDITPQLADNGSAAAYAISADGATIVGSYNPNPSGVGMLSHQFRWTASSGFEELASVDRGNWSPGRALATDRTGSRIFGVLFDFLEYASVWSYQTGTIKLDAYLQSQGLDLTGWSLLEAQASSDDGDVVVGLGYRQVGKDEVPVAWRISGLTTVGPVFADGFEVGR